jgi:hypothetical protein
MDAWRRTAKWLLGCLLSVETAAQSPEPPRPRDVWLDPLLPVGWTHDGPAGDAEGSDWEFDTSALLSVMLIDHGTPNRENYDFDTEKAAVILQGRYGDAFRFWIEPDLEGEDSKNHLAEAWGEWLTDRDRWLRVGQFRVALGTEYATRAEALPVPGYAFTSWLAGRTDTGVRLDGYADPDLWYELTATSGNGFDLEGESREHAQLSLRGVLTSDPSQGHDFQGFFGGASVAYSPDGDDHILLMTPAEQTVFTTEDLGGEDALWLGMEVGARCGPFRAGLESMDGTLSDVPVPGGTEDMDQLTAWTMLLGWSLRGEAPTWERGAWTAYGPAEHAAGQPLPIEFAVRYSNADIDRDLFDAGLASYATSTQEVRTFSAAISAYTSPDSRLMLSWVQTIADRENGLGQPDFDNDNRARNWILRWDVWFGR